MALTPKRRKALLIAAVAVFLPVALFPRVIGPWMVRHALKALILDRCATCKLDLAQVGVRLFGGGLSLKGVNFSVGDPKDVFITASIASLTADMYPLALYRRVLHLGPIVIEKPEVTVVETAEPPPDAKKDGASAEGESSEDSIDVESIRVKNGSFTYVHERKERQAGLHLKMIDADVLSFGSSPDWREHQARGHATGTLEESGRFELAVGAYLFEPAPHLDLGLVVFEQNLSDLNKFFLTDEGISLEGRLIEGWGTVAVRGKEADARVQARFQDLDISVGSTPERSGLSAFFSNLVASLRLRSKNLAADPEEQSRKVHIERESDESLVSFILRALKDAALKVASH